MEDSTLLPPPDKPEEQPTTAEQEGPSKEQVPPEEKPEPKIQFFCSICKLISTSCDYFGRKPPFARKLQITEDSYIMKDPFCPPPSSGRPNPEYFLVIGVNCAFCETPVCKSPECSFHYGKTFCSKCALENIKQFPLEIQTKVRKQLNKSTS